MAVNIPLCSGLQIMSLLTEGRADFLRDPQVAFFFHVYGGDDFAVVKEYLARKYRLRELGDEETKTGQDRKIWLEDTILFENPRRESWEKTSELLKLIKIKPGDRIADVGSGPGYYSFNSPNGRSERPNFLDRDEWRTPEIRGGRERRDGGDECHHRGD